MRLSRLWPALMLIGVLFVPRVVNNDAWFLLSDGRYLEQYGFPFTEPFSMHEGLSFVMQQWLFALGLWKLYSVFGVTGLYAFSYVACALLILAFYALLMTVSGKQRLVSAVLAALAGLIVANISCQRPQMVSTLLLLSEVLVLEGFGRREKRWPVFVLLPLLSVLLVNLHAAMWPMAVVLLLPYLASTLVFRRFSQLAASYGSPVSFSLRQLLALLLLVLLAGFLNPYGTGAMTYSLQSYGNQDIQECVNEMAPLAIRGMAFSFLLPLFFVLTFVYARCRLPLPLLFLAAGTGFMALLSVRSALLAVFFTLLPLACLGGKLPLERLCAQLVRLSAREKRELLAIGLGLLAFIGWQAVPRLTTSYVISPYLEEACDVLAQQVPPGTPVYADYQTGTYAEFRGFRPYIDARAEVFTKRLDHEKDYLHEYRQMFVGLLEYREFLARYDFPYLIVEESEPLYHHLPYEKDYELLYDSKRDSHRVSPLRGREKDIGIRLYRRIAP